MGLNFLPVPSTHLSNGRTSERLESLVASASNKRLIGSLMNAKGLRFAVVSPLFLFFFVIYYFFKFLTWNLDIWDFSVSLGCYRS